MILVINKVDRPDARIAEVIDEVYELFLDLDADESQIEFPIVYTNAKDGWASVDYDPESPVDGENLKPLLDLIVEHIPAPALRSRAPAAGARDEPRRLAVPRPHRALPRAPRHAQTRPAGRLVPHRRLDRAREGDRAVRHRRAGARGGARRPGRARSSR